MVTLWQIGNLSRWTSLFPYENSDRVQDPHDNKLDKFKKIDGTENALPNKNSYVFLETK